MGKNDTLADSVNPLGTDGTNGEINITKMNHLSTW